MSTELPERPGRLVARLARQVERALGCVDLTLPQYRVLILLCDGKEDASVLADKLAVSRPSVTGVVDGLVARGLVRREQDPADRRRVRHSLTTQGRRLLAGADAQVQLRLLEIAEHRAGGPEPVFAALKPWEEALDAYRAARRAEAAQGVAR